MINAFLYYFYDDFEKRYLSQTILDLNYLPRRCNPILVSDERKMYIEDMNFLRNGAYSFMTPKSSLYVINNNFGLPNFDISDVLIKRLPRTKEYLITKFGYEPLEEMLEQKCIFYYCKFDNPIRRNSWFMSYTGFIYLHKMY